MPDELSRQGPLAKIATLRRQGYANVPPRVAAWVLGTCELQLRRFRKQNETRLRIVPEGKRAITYPLDDLEAMATTGWRIR